MIARVYSRPGCHLCDEAVAELGLMRVENPGLEIEEIDIESDDELFKRYLERIPVVMFGEEVVSELVFDRAAVESRLGNP